MLIEIFNQVMTSTIKQTFFFNILVKDVNTNCYFCQQDAAQSFNRASPFPVFVFFFCNRMNLQNRKISSVDQVKAVWAAFSFPEEYFPQSMM